MDDNCMIREGDSIIFDERGEKMSFMKVKASGKVKVGKLTLSMQPFVGAPFGAMFEVSADGKEFQRLKRPPGEEVTNVLDTERDNSNLLDRNTDNQKLSHDEIEALKQSGKSGSEIIAELCNNSATFESKTEFSQDKYKRKKAKKYMIHVTLRKPTARAICQAYYDKGPQRVFNLRFDSLAAMLSLANIGAGGTALVIDNCMGVVLGAVMERMGGHGIVCNAHVDMAYSCDVIKSMNFTEKERSVLFSSSVGSLKKAFQEQVSKLEAGVTLHSNQCITEEAEPVASCMEDSKLSEPTLATSTSDACDHGRTANGVLPTVPGTVPSVDNNFQAVNTSCTEVALIDAGMASLKTASTSKTHSGSSTGAAAPCLLKLGSAGFSSCILAAPRMNPTSLMSQVLPLLAPSAAFVLYSPWSQPLAECMHQLQTSKSAVLLQLHESWMRPHQVLPMRTHPEMMCSGTGGYILSGIKVCTSDGSTPLTGDSLYSSKPSSIHTLGAGATECAPDCTKNLPGRKRGRKNY
ncbi:hypothetical protein CEUSTIGMA_g6733.t1 [Chlamydomonas eustigma]|uniref:tRNA (adenine(58)-N(1))-methyltransferase non-catalytic subunit TRM6 n=1 Tax=Chlamydomonas eustigma TaxID=1157962 RepID=A0A250X8S7_9CHLO|nr:hypothetical protein CEUSTIGMA_g6733.t1 [Chlamydomonas eustigma]|eukprot:GAX79292.1 hypothetical protein CEUSTIGMA_g6733.t1 [Chlamydomonas eustigma]